ncbi:sugar nucleotide-binding protein [Metasolibacillus sp. FSL K6-0083]|uniref:sugar nucleotide-binding protein n=1 Tax=Metasolibacillus sp. FSL K6-0083 TaxID=2921416 RepID=UPI003159F94E
MKKILILGASGLVGKAIAKECLNDFDVYGTYFSTATELAFDKQFQLNVQDGEVIREILQLTKPDIIVSSLRGEFEEQFNFHSLLAKELTSTKSLLYYFSTTNVFDGDLSKHHNENDEPISKSDYGQYKIRCEKMLVESLGNRANIIRIPGIWGKNSPRFNDVKSKIESAMPIQAYSNLQCNFLLDIQLARQMRFIFENELKGIFHLCAVDMMEESEFYEELIHKLTNENINIQYNLYQNVETTHYFGLLSNRDDIPKSMKMTNKEIIAYLAQ